ncbi:unnamed protein product, partial [Heterotrigona itama]
IIANIEIDFKKIIAFSTLRQLSFIISIISMGLYELAFLHLFIHAIFKSIIFICAGRFIHYIKGNQNFRIYKGIFYIYPIKRTIITISLIIICGFPFLVGFYSKDIIIESYIFLLLITGTILTISYSIRIIKTLISKSLSIKHNLH